MLPAAPKAASVRSYGNRTDFKSYYVLDGGGGVGVAVMIFEDRESANAATIKYWSLFKQACMTLILETPKSSPGKF